MAWLAWTRSDVFAAAENFNAEISKLRDFARREGGPLEFADVIITCGAAMRGVKSVGLKCVVDAACVRVPRLRQRARHEARGLRLHGGPRLLVPGRARGHVHRLPRRVGGC